MSKKINQYWAYIIIGRSEVKLLIEAEYSIEEIENNLELRDELIKESFSKASSQALIDRIEKVNNFNRP